MLVRHRDVEPSVHPEAWIAPSATVLGDVRVAAGARILHGAVVSAEDGTVEVGRDTVVMEHALVRGRARSAARIGDAVLIGPFAHVNGSSVEDEVFLATGAAVFPGSVIGRRSEVRIHGVVHVGSVLPQDSVVPIGWVAVGDPARILPPHRHDEIWAVQEGLDFPGTVYGVPRGTPMREVMAGQSEFYGHHRSDQPLP